MSAWNDFNDAEQQQHFDLIPKGTVAKVRMTIKPGGHDDAAQGWTGGYATQSFDTGSVYLACEFVVLEGELARRKLWSNVGLHSPKGPAWGNMGRTFLRAALNSARNVRPQDNSPQAAAARRIQGFHELDGLEFVARIDVEKDGRGDLRNVVKMAVEPDQSDYLQAAGATPSAAAALRCGAGSAHVRPRPQGDRGHRRRRTAAARLQRFHPLRMPDVPVAGPVLEEHTMSNSPLAQVLGERLVNAREAALCLNLPMHWLTQPKVRRRLGLPHYLVGKLVRFKLNELADWINAQQTQVSAEATGEGADAGLQ